MAAIINLKNNAGGGVNLTPASTNATTTTLTVPQDAGTLLTANTIPGATATMFGGVKLTIVGNTLTISNV